MKIGYLDPKISICPDLVFCKMAFSWKEPERFQKVDELLRRCVKCTCRILFDEVLRVDQSQAPAFVFKFSDDRC